MSICPVMWTQFTWAAEQQEQEMQKKLHDFTERVPLQRFGTEAEISAAITYLLSPAAAYITGSCLRVDGGTPNARTTWMLAAIATGLLSTAASMTAPCSVKAFGAYFV